ncbi:MAG TPA: hypothetical protein VKZ53_01980 [Candidatus Angelobacter sp.]|nr:hypothetical protein [Candidatus Angelobacter sp.]
MQSLAVYNFKAAQGKFANAHRSRAMDAAMSNAHKYIQTELLLAVLKQDLTN